jgi:hypothetical protein
MTAITSLTIGADEVKVSNPVTAFTVIPVISVAVPACVKFWFETQITPTIFVASVDPVGPLTGKTRRIRSPISWREGVGVPCVTAAITSP